MNHHEINRYDMFVRARQFGSDNAADFTSPEIAATQFAEINEVIHSLDKLFASQSDDAGTARMEYVNKEIARENLREALSEITRTARSMVYQFPGITDKFRMPRSAGDQNMIAAGWAFAENAVQYQNDFVAYGLPTDFIEDLTADTQAFQDSVNMPAEINERFAASARIGALIRRGMIAVRILHGVLKNKYCNDPEKLAAWAIASHLRRAPRD